ncbi:MAG TPA: Calx-beta domain-containing protein [Actinomycetota bacterium]|nr:Calx-beta domain-containing protein [Actinomycetota bacterium]
MKGTARLLAFAAAGLLLTTACEVFPTTMQDDPEAIEPIADMQQSITVDEPPASELQQRIVFQQGPIRPEIYTMGTTGNAPRRLTKNVQADREPSWSFDAKKIVYRCHVLTFCMSNPDGTGAEQVYTHTQPSATDVGDPKLSPDGRSIAFDAEIFMGGKESTRGDILVVNLDTKRVTNVSNTPAQEDDDPEWHPTGGLLWSRAGQIVFDDDAAPGGEVLGLTSTGVRASQPDVSPSGNRIAYVARLAGENQSDVYYFDLSAPATAEDVKVTFTPFDDVAPSWSPSGTKLAVASKDQPTDQDLEIFVVNLEPEGGGTATRRRLTFNDTNETEPDWATPQVTASIQQRLTQPEGNPPAGQTTAPTPFTFAVHLSAPVPQGQQVTVRVATIFGSATTGNDYTAVDETITFNAGEMTKSVTVSVVADTVAEPTESFTVKIMEATNATLGNVEGRGLITNDDTPPATPSPTPPPTATPTPPPGQAGGQIAYTSGVDGDYDVWIMDGDGTDKANLTSDPSSEGSPDLSPDGRNVAFQRMIGSPSGGSPPDFQIYQVPSTGGSATFLNGITDAFDVTPAWSPDGSALAWASSTSGGNPDIYTASPPNGTPAKVLDNAEMEGYAEWGRLANGTEAIAYHVQPDDPAGQWQVRLVELPSKTVRSFGEGRHPEISPDGRKLVFASNRTGGDYEIYVLDLTVAGATPTALTANTVDDFTPSWSPDGTKIAWTSHPGAGRADVFSMNANGSGQQNLTNSPTVDDFEPSWGVKPAATTPKEAAPTAILVMVPLMGAASALAARRRKA